MNAILSHLQNGIAEIFLLMVNLIKKKCHALKNIQKNLKTLIIKLSDNKRHIIQTRIAHLLLMRKSNGILFPHVRSIIIKRMDSEKLNIDNTFVKKINIPNIIIKMINVLMLNWF